MIVKWIAIVVVSLVPVLSACSDNSGGSKTTATRLAEQNSRTLTPENPSLKDIYNRSCRNCHTIAATGAPLTGDATGWTPRISKGMDVLIDNVVNGFGGMPPFGMCMDCDADQFEALIDFMALAQPLPEREN